MNTIHGAFFFASSKRSLTRDAPTPTNISTKSEPEMLKNGTPASPAIAFASKVLPVPGGPTSSTPFGILAPSCVYFPGSFKKSTISSSSSFSSCSPATLAKVTRLSESTVIFAWLLPKFIILLLLPPDDAWLFMIMNKMNIAPNTRSSGRSDISQLSAGTSVIR